MLRSRDSGAQTTVFNASVDRDAGRAFTLQARFVVAVVLTEGRLGSGGFADVQTLLVE